MSRFNTPQRNIQLVIADAQPRLLRIYKDFFENAGLEVLAVFSAYKDLISYFHSSGETGSILLIDYRLIASHGQGAISQLRRLNSNQKIVLTGGKDVELMRLNPDIVDAAILKPFTISELMETLQRITSPIRIRGSVLISDSEEMNRISSDVLSDSIKKVCVSRSPRMINGRIEVPNYTSFYLKAKEKGLQVKLITEITRENLFACKDLMQNGGVELRHLEGIVRNYSIYDEKHVLEATMASEDSSLWKQFIYTNLGSTVNETQFLFNELWKMGVPGWQKIQELERSAVPTEINMLRGTENISQTMLGMIRQARVSLDSCIVPPYSIDLSEPLIVQATVDAISRGVRCRILFDITKETLRSVQRMIEVGIEVRHLSNMKGSLGFSEKEFMTTATFSDDQTKREVVMLYGNYPGFVEQHRAMFETLWNIATPALQKMKEIEQDTKISFENS
jgi:DNA-binding NarL/FixJ family response regulator